MNSRSRKRSISNQLACGLLTAATLVLAGCQSGNSSAEQGITITVTSQLTPSIDGSGVLQTQAAGIKTFDNSEGITIRINAGYLVLWSISLETNCAEPDFVTAEPWWNWLISSAYAHTESTPLQLGSPTVIDLNAEELQPIALGTLTPPPGSYCGATTQLINADADANGLPLSMNMIGRTLYIDGAYSNDSGQSWAAFVVDTGVSLLPAKRIFPLSLILSNNQRNGEVNLSIAYQSWFNGVDMEQVADSNQLNQLFFNVTASIRAATQ